MLNFSLNIVLFHLYSKIEPYDFQSFFICVCQDYVWLHVTEKSSLEYELLSVLIIVCP